MIKSLSLGIFFLFSIVTIQGFPGNYPQVLLCSTNTTYPLSGCQYRSGYGEDFTDCGVKPNYLVLDVDEQGITEEYCTFFDLSSLVAVDPYSIVTFQTNQNSGLLVDHIVLIAGGDPTPAPLDAFTDLIYVYRSSALITILKENPGVGVNGTTLYTTTLHTEYRNYPPEYLWIKFDPSFNSSSSN